MSGAHPRRSPTASRWSAALVAFRRICAAPPEAGCWLWIGLAAAGCNLGYVLAMLHGEVMRVLLLFYLAPLWTVLLSRLLLGERLNAVGGAVVGLSLAGAYHDAVASGTRCAVAEERGGMDRARSPASCSRLSNVLMRKTPHFTIEVKSIAVFFGVVVLGMLLLPFASTPAALPRDIGTALLLLTLSEPCCW